MDDGPKELRSDDLREDVAEQAKVTLSPAELDPPGTFRDTGNMTSLDESRAEAHVNRYFIKWSPPLDRDEAHPWVAINHEAGLQRMPNDLMDRYPIVPAEVVQQRLAQ